jgi:bifunctional non-homologous end joining protein LigD
VDYLQNIRAKTVAGVYSVRAKPGATVSTPLQWKEVVPKLDPRTFTIETMPARIQRLGDLWATAARTKNTLQGILDAAAAGSGAGKGRGTRKRNTR